jgi:hypothetical protein
MPFWKRSADLGNLSPIRLRKLVTPFYLHMMGTNALRLSDQEWDEFVLVADSVEPTEVRRLLGFAWRECVMGAWFSMRQDSTLVRDDVLLALRNSRGSLTSPVLIAASIVHAGTDAIPAISEYRDNDLRNGWGSTGFADVALHHLDAQPRESVMSGDTTEFETMLRLASDLRKR